MTITKLIEKNFKRIESIDLSPGDRTLVVLRGPNESGKTSAIDGIIAALCGQSACPEVPVRTGTDGASVKLTLSKDQADIYEVVREWDAEGKSKLSVFDLTGERRALLRAGQTLLDSMLADLTFDPLAFMKAEPQKRTKMLLAAAGLEAEHARAVSERNAACIERTDIGREVKNLTEKLRGRTIPKEPLTLISEADVAKEAADAQKKNTQIERVKADIEKSETAIRELEENIRLATIAIGEARVRIEDKEAELKTLGDPISTEDFSKRLAEIRTQNTDATSQNEALEMSQSLKTFEKAYEKAVGAIEAIDKGMIERLTQSSIGDSVPGLVVRDGEIWHNDVPFEQASGMRQLELSCLLGMAANPKVRVLLIDEADKLDDEAIERVIALAKDRGFQVWATGVRIGDASNAAQCVCDMSNGTAKEVGSSNE